MKLILCGRRETGVKIYEWNNLQRHEFDPNEKLPKQSEPNQAIQSTDSVIKDAHLELMSDTESDDTKSNEWLDLIRLNVIGRRCIMSTPFGKKEMVYADYTASGRCLEFVEKFMQKIVTPTYGNTHTEASMTGAQTSRLREEARDIIREALHAPKEEYAVLFTGTGATGAIQKLVSVLGLTVPEYVTKKWKVTIPKKERPVVFISHFEHHSNDLIWRESIAKCVVIPEGEDGTPDLNHLEKELRKYATKGVPLIGSFSAGSNVTGIRSPVHKISKLLHRFGAYSFFDYAGTGAYVGINMSCDGRDESMDAIFISPHKFVGGPGSAGVLVARHKLFENAFGIRTTKATTPGGGTVTFVTRKTHSYIQNPESREDAGTPGILQSIKTGLVFKVKEMVGAEKIEELEHEHMSTVLKRWRVHPMISLLGSDKRAYNDVACRVSIFSFNILSGLAVTSVSKYSTRMVIAEKMKQYVFSNGHPTTPNIPLHYNFVATLLNDIYGIQGRGGCSCAGPYGVDLMGVSTANVATKLKMLVEQDLEVFKPGWCRVNFNYFIGHMEADFIIEAIEQIATHGWKILPLYVISLKSGQFVNRLRVNICSPAPYSVHDMSNLTNSKDTESDFLSPKSLSGERLKIEYNNTLKQAMKIYQQKIVQSDNLQDFTTELPKHVKREDIWWLLPSEAAKTQASPLLVHS